MLIARGRDIEFSKAHVLIYWCLLIWSVRTLAAVALGSKVHTFNNIAQKSSPLNPVPMLHLAARKHAGTIIDNKYNSSHRREEACHGQFIIAHTAKAKRRVWVTCRSSHRACMCVCTRPRD